MARAVVVGAGPGGLASAIALRRRGWEVTVLERHDPHGALPGWLVNMFQKGWPEQTFEGIRRQAAKPDITMPAEFRDVLGPTEQF